MQGPDPVAGLADIGTVGVRRRPSPLNDEYIERNRSAWEAWAPAHLAAGRKAWKHADLRWGLWGVPESRLGLFRGLTPEDDVIELGCGTGEISAWLMRQGARPVAIDFAARQVRNVESLQLEFGVTFPVIRANAEDVMYEDASFDIAVSEYGASVWCDPEQWLAEASRLLRPNGRLIFFTSSEFLMVCTPETGAVAEDRLVRDYFTRSRVEFEDSGPVEFHLTHGEWIRLLRANRFIVDDLVQVRPPSNARPRFKLATLEWARRWPSEDVWIARRLA